MTDWVPVAELADLAGRKRLLVHAAGEPIALFRVGEEVFALHDTCIHKQRSLSKGVLLNEQVVCPGHQWEFDPRTGYAAEHDRYQPSYEVRIEDGRIYVNTQQRVPGHDYEEIASA